MCSQMRGIVSIFYIIVHFVSFSFLFLFFLLFFFVFWYISVASAAHQRPTSSYHTNPAGSPTRNDMSLQVGEMPDLNPGLQVLQPGALPLSHHIPILIPVLRVQMYCSMAFTLYVHCTFALSFLVFN